MEQNVIIFESCAHSNYAELMDRCSNELHIPIFNPDTNKSKHEFITNSIEYIDPYIVNFLKQTKNSVIFNRKYPSQYVYSNVDNLDINSDIFAKIDSLYSEMGTTIIFCYKTQFEDVNIKQLHDKTYTHYINFFNNSMCKILPIDISEKIYKNVTKIISYIETQNKIKNYRDLFYKKLVNCSSLMGDKILFVIDGEFDHLTYADIDNRLHAKTGDEFNFICNRQFRNSDDSKFINEVLSRSNVHKFETSTSMLRKTDFKKISKFDLQLLESEIDMLRPNMIITFSKNVSKFASQLNSTKFTKIKNFDLPIVYSNELFNDIANEINSAIK